ncbi:hypothetical protein [Actinoplanes regularis]|uniref:hypothetical protein n=1 Tax=Actinoplanes regularis TaxID=52697 RepID=UPI0024A4B86F|nr:hypothetical protein [Actinoplanes regularis]GLW33755.1 hypothetical protein Areg01_66930 [Actinoplanes regularis]
MTELSATITPALSVARPRPAVPWAQAGLPRVRVEVTEDPIYPYLLQVGDLAATPIPMTVPAVGALRDALTAALTQAVPAKSEDFVADWARTHGAAIVSPTVEG